MTRYTEEELVLPSLYLMSKSSDGHIHTSELIGQLLELMKPDGEDLEILSGRSDTKFSQRVRNLKSHNNFERRGFAVYRNEGFEINDEGINYLISNFSSIEGYLGNKFEAEKERLFSKRIKEDEQNLSETDDYAKIPPSDIVAFNELRSCADLVRMYKSEQLIIKPDFQRDLVWLNPARTRFIDSLIKQLPIPSMCISLDYKTNKRLMIDGLQRIYCIIKFLTEDNWKLSPLDDVDSRISGKIIEQIKIKHHELYSRLENLTIPVTVLRCDYSKDDHMQYLFTIFHRLNTGGNKLNNQEIRNCIYQGNFNDFLKSLVSYSCFVKLFNIVEGKIYRFSFEELILRFFAFFDEHQSYNGKLAKFLNEYMNKHKELEEQELSTKRNIFERVIDLLFLRIQEQKALPNLSKATIESMFVGIANNIENLENETESELKQRFRRLRKDEAFSVDSLKENISGKEKVKQRISRAIEIFL